MCQLFDVCFLKMRSELKCEHEIQKLDVGGRLIDSIGLDVEIHINRSNVPIIWSSYQKIRLLFQRMPGGI